MNCPNCGAVCPEHFRFCYACGMPLEREKKGTHLVPILILIGLTVLGLWVYFATGAGSADPRPNVSQDPVFTVTHGALYTDSTFDGVTELTVPAVVGGQRVTAIGRYCFAECEDLTVVHLPDTVRSIGEFAFAGCGSLRAMELPGSVEEIGGDVFRDCPSLEAVHIPASATYMGQSVFDGCDSLSFIFYDGTVSQWTALFDGDLPAGTTVICADGTLP